MKEDGGYVLFVRGRTRPLGWSGDVKLVYQPVYAISVVKRVSQGLVERRWRWRFDLSDRAERGNVSALVLFPGEMRSDGV